MSDKIRKYVLPNLPYLFVFWFFSKIGTAYRIAAGAEFGTKLMGMLDTFPKAFETYWPGLGGIDLLVGLAGAAGAYLLIQSKIKKAKKFRRDAEYGTARWGTKEDIKPFVDPKFQNNIILTGTEFLTMNTRPKIPANARNLNACVIGSSGSGKTRFWLTPQLLQAHSSYVVVDPKGGTLDQYSPLIKRLGGQVIEIAPDSPHHINPMDIDLSFDEENPMALKADFILSLMELIVGGKDGLQPVERTVIDRCVRQMYREHLQNPETAKMPTLQTLYDLLCSQPEGEAVRLATALEIYVSGSLNVFNHETNVDLNRRLVCLDLKKLGAGLRTIAMLIMQDLVNSQVSMNFLRGIATWCYFDEFHSRCLKGFHMSGQAPYGYQLEPTVVEGIRTKKMVADPVAADHVRLMFEMYAEPETSFGDITRYFEEQGIKIYEKSMVRSFLSQLLRNPVYAQADLELYEFFKSQGAAIVNDASDFAGTNGCYLYQGRDVKEDKDRCLKDQILVIAPHEALIPSDVWLKCRKKLMTNTTFQQGRKPKNTWLAGKIKCGHCGYALKATRVPNGAGYFRCTKRTENKGCPGCGKIHKDEFEQFIFMAMQEKFKDFQILHGKEEKASPKLTAYQVELAQVEAEIEKLLDTLTGANATLLAYANKKIEELDTRRQTISKAIADLSVETISPQQIKKLSYYLDNWESIDFDDKRKAADGLISTIKATSDRVQIEWKI